MKDELNKFRLVLFLMILTIDIGNTLTKCGFFEGENLVERLIFPTVKSADAEQINLQFKTTGKISAVVISSVVPEIQSAYTEFFGKNFGIEPVFVNNRFNFGLKIKYEPPENLGVDRIVDTFAAAVKYGAPCIVCDFGTATTIDAVNSSREYLGGIIAPGMKTLADALFLKTSKLPLVEIAKPEKVIGNSTVRSIQSGVFFGYLGLVENILRKMSGELNESARVVATGGFANLIAENVSLIEIVDENLMLDGLRLIYEKMNKI
jgi:type III pantothenate kinase